MEHKFILLALCVYLVCVEDVHSTSPDDILEEARRNITSTSWSYESCKHDYCNRNKCNLFVYDVLTEVGATAPSRRWWKYSPIGANEWGNPDSSYVRDTNCYDHISDLSDKEGGDIIAFPSSSGSGHVGIVSSGGKYISAQSDEIEEKDIPSGRTTVLWRYTC